MIDTSPLEVSPTKPSTEPGQALVEAVVAEGPSGAFAIAGIATAIVVALYLAFYFFAYLPRGVMQ